MKIKIKDSPKDFKYFTHDELLKYWPECYSSDNRERLLTVVYEAHKPNIDVLVFVDMGFTRNVYIAYKEPKCHSYTLRSVAGRSKSIVSDIVETGIIPLVVDGFFDSTNLLNSKLNVYTLAPL